MRLFAHALLLSALLAGCAAAPLARAPAPQATQLPQQAARPDPQNYVRALFSRFPDRMVDVEEHRSGPGFQMLSHVTLYEQPESSSTAGLCQVRVHDVGLPAAAPPADPPREATWVRTSTRWFAIGEVGPRPVPADQAARCAALASARNFFASSAPEVGIALQVLTDARRYAVGSPRAISFGCTAWRHSCGDPAALFLRDLRPDLLAEVRQVACEPGRPGGGQTCFRYTFRRGADGGDWTVNIKGPERPLHVLIRQDMPPVV